jgi:hypothetical protein
MNSCILNRLSPCTNKQFACCIFASFAYLSFNSIALNCKFTLIAIIQTELVHCSSASQTYLYSIK